MATVEPATVLELPVLNQVRPGKYIKHAPFVGNALQVERILDCDEEPLAISVASDHIHIARDDGIPFSIQINRLSEPHGPERFPFDVLAHAIGSMSLERMGSDLWVAHSADRLEVVEPAGLKRFAEVLGEHL